MPTPSSTVPTTGTESRSPSPDAEELVFLTLHEHNSREEKTDPSVRRLPSGMHMYGAVNRTFDLTSSLLGRDKRYGSTIAALRDEKPKSLDSILPHDVLELLDHHLLWHKLYMPWLPSLRTLWDEIAAARPSSTSHLSASTLLALLATIALDVPSERLAQYRNLRLDLQCIVYHLGQKLLFMLPRDEYTLIVLELVMNHRPLALVDSQEAAAHTLSGNLFGTLISAMQQRLGFDAAPKKLRGCLASGQPANVEVLVLNTLRWCASTMRRMSQDLQELETNRSELYEPEVALQAAFEITAEAIDRFSLDKCFFLFHVLRYHADDLIATRGVIIDWQDTAKLSEHIETHVELRNQRRKDYDLGLTQFFFNDGRTHEGLALSQLITIEQGQGYSNVIGLAMFFAVMRGFQAPSTLNTGVGNDTMAQLSMYWTQRVNHEAAKVSLNEQTEAGAFLQRYGDMHMDALEKRLTDFINAATEVSLQGVPFVGPPRHTSTNVLMACKEILENNAVRIKIDNVLHPRVDMQLILLENAARQLERMEADGGSPEAVACGSVFTACAKVIRNLHRVMRSWKRQYRIQVPQPHCDHKKPYQHKQLPEAQPGISAASNPWPTFGFALDDFSTDGLFTDWDSWPQLDSDMFAFDFDTRHQ
ncbi:uncharacterized protein LTR77_010398 [Saxophila tyrrhenica]|uniref:Uncharacterized protein n=1 Tax=Saxophila tyrrhenica TaxID=1690608 RepID=A0AAV9NX14_9PEZI|nr:hypothetical protein LTR77_010398 [Saxophila tyrrhenica]